MWWMNLEPVIQSEVSQKEKNKDSILNIYMEYQGRGSLVGCRLWGCTESDMTEATKQQ